MIKSHPAENDEWYDGEDLVREMTRYIHMNFHSVLHLEDLARAILSVSDICVPLF